VGRRCRQVGTSPVRPTEPGGARAAMAGWVSQRCGNDRPACSHAGRESRSASWVGSVVGVRRYPQNPRTTTAGSSSSGSRMRWLRFAAGLHQAASVRPATSRASVPWTTCWARRVTRSTLSSWTFCRHFGKPSTISVEPSEDGRPTDSQRVDQRAERADDGARMSWRRVPTAQRACADRRTTRLRPDDVGDGGVRVRRSARPRGRERAELVVSSPTVGRSGCHRLLGRRSPRTAGRSTGGPSRRIGRTVSTAQATGWSRSARLRP